MLLGRSSSGQMSTGSRSASYRRIARSRWHHSTGSILVSTGSAGASRSEDNVTAVNGTRPAHDRVTISGVTKSQRFRVQTHRSQVSYTPPPTTIASDLDTDRAAANSLPPQLDRPGELVQSHDRLSLELQTDHPPSPTRLREFDRLTRTRPRPRSASSSTSKFAVSNCPSSHRSSSKRAGQLQEPKLPREFATLGIVYPD
ncbi:unnamed protein product [Echinostoma caproni]|uniref:Uncharacterized protein n=1 Tax=Echinostoma caproni TaxID=27848 RepID=A0A183A1J1_9TREM|nr:unnamed protein product [Echinostoma caproni]